MSHVVQIQTQVRDPAAVFAACERLQLPPPTQGKFKMFEGFATGLGVQLPGWKYRVVCDMASGHVSFDNYNGAWGDRVELDRFLQAYAVEKARSEARRQGHTVTEQSLADGSIKLTIQVVGGAV